MFLMLVIDSALKALSDLSDRIDSALRLLVLLQNAGISVRFMWMPSHIGVPGNEATDMAAKAACSVRSDAPVFGADLLALLRRQPKIVCWQSAFVQFRCDEVALCRLCIGHCRLTHGLLMSRDPFPMCVADGVQLSVHIFLLHALDFLFLDFIVLVIVLFYLSMFLMIVI
uniref:Uncharacterized protein n=1 Tax=Strigamia maritima TaxID=126957 RepID=T1JC57_STRMM